MRPTEGSHNWDIPLGSNVPLSWDTATVNVSLAETGVPAGVSFPGVVFEALLLVGFAELLGFAGLLGLLHAMIVTNITQQSKRAKDLAHFFFIFLPPPFNF